MKTAMFMGARRFEVRDAETPSPGPGEVLVRMRNIGVCGSDLHFFRGDFPLPPEFILGHECAGEIAALGENVHGLAAGDQVALELFGVCLTCAQCRSGDYQLCVSRKAFGINTAGGLREYMVLPAYTAYRLPPGVDAELGALCEPLAVAVHGLRLANITFGDRVAVLGAGTIGLCAIAAARAMGAGYIAATAKHPQQREMALAMGADDVFDPGADGAGQMAKALGGGDVVVETVGGHADTFAQTLTLVGTRGRIVILGAFTAPVQFHPIMLFLKEPTIHGANCYGRGGRRSDYEMAIEIVRRDPERMRRLITHRFPLAAVADAYATADDKASGAIKVTITP